MKYATVVMDTIGEQARLYFSKAIGKSPKDMEKLRNVSHYQPTTERLNIFTRRLKDLKTRGSHCVFIGHEQIDKIYAEGGQIGQKGQQPQEPIGVRGIPDLPGSTFPEELLRKCDCILRMRMVSGKPTWVAREEPLGASLEKPWVAGCRFDAMALKFPNDKGYGNGYLPPSYQLIEQACLEQKLFNWQPPYIWMIYGRSKIGKTTTVLNTFPKPMIVYDFDDGTSVLGNQQRLTDMGITVKSFNVEASADYDRFLQDFEQCFT